MTTLPVTPSQALYPELYGTFLAAAVTGDEAGWKAASLRYRKECVMAAYPRVPTPTSQLLAEIVGALCYRDEGQMRLGFVRAYHEYIEAVGGQS